MFLLSLAIVFVCLFSYRFSIHSNSKSIYEQTKVFSKRSYVYKTFDRKRAPLSLDVFRTSSAPVQGAPALLYVHGGSWKHGSKTLNKRWKHIFKRITDKGVVAISIDYRLYQPKGYRYTDPIEDVEDAVEWVYDHAQELGIDPSRIGLAGASAGGHLVLMAAQSNDVASHLSYLIAWYPITDLKGMVHQSNPVSRIIVERYMNGTYDMNQENYRQISPLSYSYAHTPPLLLVHGTGDELVESSQSIRLARQNPTNVHLVLLPKGNHGLINLSIQKSTADTIQYILKNK